MEKLTLSPSKVRKWVRCRKSYHWRYNRKLVRVRKEVPMSLGSVVGKALADYYWEAKDLRNQEKLARYLENSLSENKSSFLGKEPNKERLDDWNKLERTSKALLSRYHDYAKENDEFEVVSVETPYNIELTPKVSLMAIPDTVVKDQTEGLPLVLEHKVRYRFRTGDFGIDYQSVYSCLVSGAIGTIYNVLEYSKPKYHRDIIIRSNYELNYFKDMLVRIGNDILNTLPENMYPMPFKRCQCEYWELCQAEMTGIDIEDVIGELYTKSIRPEGAGEPGEPGEQT